MPWQPLSSRINDLPLILAGPILRRVEPDAVTVWVALRQARNVTLQLFRTRAREGRPDELDNTVLLEETAATVALGPHLHVIAVTARADSSVPVLVPGEIYAYNLSFRGSEHLASSGADDVLNSAIVVPPVSISYFHHRLPTFAMPPNDLSKLRLVHGSCRKPHDPGRDALAILDFLIDADRHFPIRRPHQLFLTGDQIYAEEVKDPLLWLLMDAAQTLFVGHEVLPSGQSAGDLMPGLRARAVGTEAGMFSHGEGQLRSHVISLGEYCVMYLFVWSHLLWPDSLPSAEEVADYLQMYSGTGGLSQVQQQFIESLDAAAWAEANGRLTEFVADIPRVRRALANVPTYMIFDDHDVTDDWFINRAWTATVMSTPLGKRVIQNALIAYAIFQHWGNSPEQFEPGQSGRLLLDRVAQLTGGSNEGAIRDETDRYVGLPPADGGPARTVPDDGQRVLYRDPASLRWEYIVEGPKHEVIVLDTRTRRGFRPELGRSKDPAAMLSPSAFQQQLAAPLRRPRQNPVEITCVVAPTNPVGIRIIDLAQGMLLGPYLDHKSDFGITALDVGDAWNFHERAFATLLSTLFDGRSRVVLLSGDIHFGYAVRLSYWARRPFGAPATGAQRQEGTLGQLTSSAFKNADSKEFLTKVIHTKAMPMENDQDWAGWNDWPGLLRREAGSWYRDVLPDEPPVVRRIDDRHLGDDEYAVTDQQHQPDWRYHIQFKRRDLMPGQTRAAFALPSAPPVIDDRLGWLSVYDSLIAAALAPPGTRLLAGASAAVDLPALSKSPWFQEGNVIVGLHNIGVVTFEWPADVGKAVIQDLYFWPLGAGAGDPFSGSRYRVSLELDPEPPAMPVRPSP
jgi:hypothetical protein